MASWTRGAAAGAAALAAAGCVLPMEIAMEVSRWGAPAWEPWGPPEEDVRGWGDVVTEARDVAGFGAVSATGPLRLVVVRSGDEQVTVTAEESLLPYLETEVRSGVLHVGPAEGVTLEPQEDIVVHVECEEVMEISASGGVVAEADLGWLPELWIWLNGDATLSAQGEADRQHVALSGASLLDAVDLRSERVDARLSGASEAVVWARDRLRVDAGGASRLRFRGDPDVDARVSAAAKVTRYER